MQRLKVSKALISLSLNDLLKYDVILESGKSSRGTQTYIPNPDVLDVILNVIRRRERKMLTKAETSHKMLSSLSEDSLRRARLSNEKNPRAGKNDQPSAKRAQQFARACDRGPDHLGRSERVTQNSAGVLIRQEVFEGFF